MDKICIIGLGYVGLPLAVEFAKKYEVMGLDLDEARIKELTRGFDRTNEVSQAELLAVSNNLEFTTISKLADQSNVYIVTVPTPIDSENRPDLSPLISASTTVGTLIKRDDIVIYESTVYPGVTEDICIPEIERVSNLRYNEDFFAGYSPERINPGDKDRRMSNIIKVTSGSTPEIAIKIDDLYRSIMTVETHLAPTIRVAEASKVIENTQRDVNIALVNELALIFDQMGIDTNAVLDAAATKWNFIKLSPGLVGGHCIGVDPYYLTHKAKEMGYSPNLILASRQINNGMAKFVAERTIKEMIKAGILIKASKILILGYTFKEDCGDTRNTKVVDIISELEEYGANVSVYDPWIDNETNSQFLKSSPFEKDQTYDAIIVAVSHAQFKELTSEDYQRISQPATVIMDIKGIAPAPTWRL